MELTHYSGGPSILKSKSGARIPVFADTVVTEGQEFTRIAGEFWTSRQRMANSIHEIPYRACFKAELPGFFISEYARSGSRLFDPFAGRGTTLVEGVLRGIPGTGIDSNPLSAIMAAPRWNIPTMTEIKRRLDSIFKVSGNFHADTDLSMFYHPGTESEIVLLRDYLTGRRESGEEDRVDKWIRMVATSRLSGHSSGFFSVYTLPPNQAASQKRQARINRKLGRSPEYRDVKKLIMRKSQSLLRDVSENLRLEINRTGEKTEILAGSSEQSSSMVEEGSITLTVTSPPFLNIVQYGSDNWLRCWFNSIDLKTVGKDMFISGNLDGWKHFIRTVLGEIHAVTEEGGRVAFEVGDVRMKGNTVNLDEIVGALAVKAGFDVKYILVNAQNFTKTSNIWGIDNLKKGTNTNRIVLMEKS